MTTQEQNTVAKLEKEIQSYTSQINIITKMMDRFEGKDKKEAQQSLTRLNANIISNKESIAFIKFIK